MEDEGRQKQTDAELLRQAAEAIGEPLLSEVDVTDDDALRIANALVKAVNAGWNLGVQRREMQIENEQRKQANLAR